MNLVGFFLQVAHVLGLSLLVVQALLMAMQDDVIVLVTARNLFLLTEEYCLGHLSDFLYLLAVVEFLSQLDDGLFAHAIQYQVGSRLAEDALLELVLPIVVMTDAAHGSLDASECHRYVGIELLQYLGIDDGRVVGTHVVARVGAEGILASHTAIGGVAVHHGVHGSWRHAEEEARSA